MALRDRISFPRKNLAGARALLDDAGDAVRDRRGVPPAGTRTKGAATPSPRAAPPRARKRLR
jgi:hypothetical protein